ncbi:MAG: histidine ammonia-lyase [Bdellovibrionales bacterium]|nr:histidine ammonia-lyase [Bdellovibrionales bacterium]
MATKPFRLGQDKITLEAVREIARFGRKVVLTPTAKKKIERAYRYLRSRTEAGETIYGVNTGFGLLSSVRIPEHDLEELQYNLLRSHSVGTGAPISVAQSRAMLFLRAANLSIGHSGVRVALVEQILKCLNAGVTPWIPEQGSVGASGDLAPLSHLSLVLIGEGRAYYRGKLMPGSRALKAARLKPIRLGPKEGLALINGTQFMTAIGTLALLDAEYVCDVADFAGAMTVEALKGTTSAFDADIQRVRPHPGQAIVAKRLRAILRPAGKESEITHSHEDCGKVQDPYSLRCMPQVHGASRDTLRFVREVLEREVNAVTDNPLVFPSGGKVLSGGNFHGQIVSIAMDALSIAMAEIASISEQRIEKLVNPAMSGLPAFLVQEGGVNSGFMIVQVAAASIVSENKTLAHPASVDSIPTSADKEDHVSMGAWAARKATRILENSRRVIAMELLAASTGLEFHRPLKSSPKIEATIRALRRRVKPIKKDRTFHLDMGAIETMLIEREIDAEI